MRKIQRTFKKGFWIIVPFTVLLWALYQASGAILNLGFTFFDNPIRVFFINVAPAANILLNSAIFCAGVYTIGLLSKVEWLHSLTRRLFGKIPIISGLVESFFAQESFNFEEKNSAEAYILVWIFAIPVVVVKEIQILGIDYAVCYFATSPFPLTGFTVPVKKSELVYTGRDAVAYGFSSSSYGADLPSVSRE